jgi:hypothetical protein
MKAPRVLIAIPHGGTIKGSLLGDVFAEAFAHAQMVQFLLGDLPGTYGFHSRWLAAKQAVDHDCDYLWLMDNDMQIPQGALSKLMAADKDIIGTHYHMRKLPLQTVVTMLTDHGMIEFANPAMMPNEPFLCHSVGFGCTLVKVSALKKIPQPWFKCEWDEHGQLSKTDDRWFCEQAKRVGIDTWCEPTIDVKHLGDYPY